MTARAEWAHRGAASLSPAPNQPHLRPGCDVSILREGRDGGPSPRPSPPAHGTHGTQPTAGRGRSNALFFEPDDPREPIAKFPLKRFEERAIAGRSLPPPPQG